MHMNLQAALDKIMCQTFLTTIKVFAKVWFSQLKPNSISNFTELSRQLFDYFINGQKHRKPTTYLMNIK